MPFRCPQPRLGLCRAPKSNWGQRRGEGGPVPCGLLTPGLQRPTAPGPMSCGGWGYTPHSYPQEAVPGLLSLPSAGPASPLRPAISSPMSPTPSHVPPWSERLVSLLCVSLRGSGVPEGGGKPASRLGLWTPRGAQRRPLRMLVRHPDKWKPLTGPGVATPGSWEHV